MYKLNTSHWHIPRILFLIAGSIVLTSGIAIVLTESLWFLAPILLVGSMQILFALTGYCPAAIVLDSFTVPHA